ncbi:F-box domain-containing protein [Mycena sanguinolenta]|uniref:F-box domain-containing protein n=1 Tax=Mycena sanguinolenta TaxID=230812 RepID=A0A8H6Y074_9AGAR|nr:F-box domain-containing protein [Mycena sanguinolenta]
MRMAMRLGAIFSEYERYGIAVAALFCICSRHAGCQTVTYVDRSNNAVDNLVRSVVVFLRCLLLRVEDLHSFKPLQCKLCYSTPLTMTVDYAVPRLQLNGKALPPDSIFRPYCPHPFIHEISDEILQEIFLLAVSDTKINIPNLTVLLDADEKNDSEDDYSDSEDGNSDEDGDIDTEGEGLDSIDSEDSSSVGPICLTHVCSRWRKVALETPGIWTRFSVYLDASPITLQAIEFFLARASMRKPLDLEIMTLEVVPLTILTDIVLPHAARLTSLGLEVDEAFVESFIRLPPRSFPSLRSLKLTPRIDGSERLSAPSWFLYPPLHPGISHENDNNKLQTQTQPTPLGHLAPGLRKLSITPNPYYSCIRHLYPAALGLPLRTLTDLELSASVPSASLLEILPCLGGVKRLTVRMDANTGWEPAGMEVDDEDDEGQDDGAVLAGLANALLRTDGPHGENVNVPFELAMMETANPIILPALTHLHLTFSSYPAASALFTQLTLPALESLALIVEAAHVRYCETLHAVLMQFLQRSLRGPVTRVTSPGRGCVTALQGAGVTSLQDGCADTMHPLWFLRSLALFDVRALSETQAADLSGYCANGFKCAVSDAAA